MALTKITKKEQTLMSDDLRIDRKAVVKAIMVNTGNPAVIQVQIQLFAIPNEQREMCEYEEQIERIRKKSQRLLRDYVRKNSNLFDERNILDFNFTPANLRKGYNKSVSISVYVRQKNIMKFTRIRNRIRETFKETANMITDAIREEDFKCYKKRQAINNRTK